MTSVPKAEIRSPNVSRGDGQQPRKVLWALVVGLAALSFVAHHTSLHDGFIWDDDVYVTRNPLLTSFAGLLRIWVPLGTVQYYPLIFSSFWIEHKLWGFDPVGYHVTNVALHAGNAVLVFLVLRRLRIPGAALAAAIFAVHPVHVESVAWITERKNVLSGFFYLLSFLSYLRFEERWQARWYVIALGLFLCALMSKSVTCSLPAVLVLLWWLEKREIGAADIGRLLPFLATGAAMGLLTIWIERNNVGARGTEWDLSIAQRTLIAGRALWFYVGKLLWPTRLTFIYPRWTVDASNVWAWTWPALAAAVAAAAWHFRVRWGRGVFAALAFFAVTLAPALGFINTYPMRYSFVADHFQYLASIGIIALSAAGLSAAAARLLPRLALSHVQRRLIVAAATIPFLMTLTLLTWRQGRVYENLETLWTDTLRKNPGAWIAHNNLGDVWYSQKRLDEALAAYRAALELKPDLAIAHSNIGNIYNDQGRAEEAIAEQRRALEIEPDNPGFLYNLGSAYARIGRLDDAVKAYVEAVTLKPSFGAAHFHLAVLYYHKKEFARAIYHCDKAVETGYPVPARSLELLRPYRK